MRSYFLPCQRKTLTIMTYAAGNSCSYEKCRESTSLHKSYAYLKEGSAPWCRHHNLTLSLVGALQAPPHLPHPCDQGNYSCGRVAVHGLYVVSSHSYPDPSHRRTAMYSYSKPQTVTFLLPWFESSS